AVLHGESLSQLYNAHPHPYGYTNGFVKGLWPPFNYLSMVNELEGRPKVLLVGEARSFYVVPSCEYAVVFNRQPLADAIRRWMGPEPSEQQMSRDGGQQVLQWLRSRGITHVLVDWAELLRLQRTYGMDPILNPAVFAQLESAGLVRVSDWSIQDHAPYYATLYEVPNE
ncbi:MAG: hypothetical protein FWC56_03515, partial [Phycisphaerae bacterium]|nr:hypothetical protein [Phycisphaerae bacterium]